MRYPIVILKLLMSEVPYMASSCVNYEQNFSA